jgi:hypothetical protein
MSACLLVGKKKTLEDRSTEQSSVLSLSKEVGKKKVLFAQSLCQIFLTLLLEIGKDAKSIDIFLDKYAKSIDIFKTMIMECP